MCIMRLKIQYLKVTTYSSHYALEISTVQNFELFKNVYIVKSCSIIYRCKTLVIENHSLEVKYACSSRKPDRW